MGRNTFRYPMYSTINGRLPCPAASLWIMNNSNSNSRWLFCSCQVLTWLVERLRISSPPCRNTFASNTKSANSPFFTLLFEVSLSLLNLLLLKFSHFLKGHVCSAYCRRRLRHFPKCPGIKLLFGSSNSSFYLSKAM